MVWISMPGTRIPAVPGTEAECVGGERDRDSLARVLSAAAAAAVLINPIFFRANGPAISPSNNLFGIMSIIARSRRVTPSPPPSTCNGFVLQLKSWQNSFQLSVCCRNPINIVPTHSHRGLNGEFKNGGRTQRNNSGERRMDFFYVLCFQVAYLAVVEQVR